MTELCRYPVLIKFARLIEDDSYWRSRRNSLELVNLSGVHKGSVVSLVVTLDLQRLSILDLCTRELIYSL